MGIGNMAQTTVLEYEAPWAIYALDWCKTPAPGLQHRPRSSYRLAIASYTEDYRNRLAVIGLRDEGSLFESDDYPSSEGDFYTIADTMHGYPATKLQWQPASASAYGWAQRTGNGELLATVGDALRIWELLTDVDPNPSAFVGRTNTHLGKLAQKIALTGKSKSPPTISPAPLTSFSWNAISPALVVTSSIDTTCTVWDINSYSAITQLIAHDREVYDVAWLPGSTDIFCSVGADGSLRAFDLRSLEHSTILYEAPGPKQSPSSSSSSVQSRPLSTPLLRIAFNPSDCNYMATFHVDSSDIQILDMRSPGSPVVELKAHRGQLTALGWGTSEGGMLASAGDDCQLLLWDLASVPPVPSPRASRQEAKKIKWTEPSFAYNSQTEINNIGWSPQLPGMTMPSGLATTASEWLAVAAGKSLRCLKLQGV